jgi:hypothetical protein
MRLRPRVLGKFQRFAFLNGYRPRAPARVRAVEIEADDLIEGVPYVADTRACPTPCKD